MDATAKTPAKYFVAIPKKDAFRNFERGYLQSNHRKITECGLFGAPERQVASFGSRVPMVRFSIVISIFYATFHYVACHVFLGHAVI